MLSTLYLFCHILWACIFFRDLCSSEQILECEHVISEKRIEALHS